MAETEESRAEFIFRLRHVEKLPWHVIQNRYYRKYDEYPTFTALRLQYVAETVMRGVEQFKGRGRVPKSERKPHKPGDARTYGKKK